MTVAMSDTDYATLVQAASWIRAHAGTDAPEYPQRRRLADVVDGIARRQRPEITREWWVAKLSAKKLAQLRETTPGADKTAGVDPMPTLDLRDDDPNWPLPYRPIRRVWARTHDRTPDDDTAGG